LNKEQDIDSRHHCNDRRQDNVQLVANAGFLPSIPPITKLFHWAVLALGISGAFVGVVFFILGLCFSDSLKDLGYSLALSLTVLGVSIMLLQLEIGGMQ
jgi:hypothetical protein